MRARRWCALKLWMAHPREVCTTVLNHCCVMVNKLSGETIPIRLFLGGFDLTPTFREVNKKFSTRYYLSLVLIDEGELYHICSSHCLVFLQHLFLTHF